MSENKSIYEMLDITPVENKPVATIPDHPMPAVVIEKDDEHDSFDGDFEDARKNLLYVIEMARNAAEDVHAIAKDKESAKEFEAFNQLLRTVGDASGNLLKFHEMRKKHKTKERVKEETKNGIAVSNAVFVGSPSELRKMLKED